MPVVTPRRVPLRASAVSGFADARGFRSIYNNGDPPPPDEGTGMKKAIVIVIALGLCGYFAQRRIAAASACRKLADVPAAAAAVAQADGGFAHLCPTQPLAAYRQSGRHTVFIFSAQWCPGCRSLEAQLPHFLELRRDVAIRHISVDDPAASQRAVEASGVKLRSIPHVVIYNADGELAAEDDGSDKAGLETLVKWMNDELQREAAGARR
jgi:thiol-disulfide isomerase/thioredoxin